MPKREKPDPLTRLFTRMSGSWQGDMSTWFEPDKPPTTGKMRGKIELAAGGSSLLHTYRAKAGENAHRGLMLMGADIDHHKLAGSWTDTMHTMGKVLSMLADGNELKDGFSVAGKYAFGDIHWGWKITHQLVKKNRLEIRHSNVLPEGQEILAILVEYRRIE